MEQNFKISVIIPAYNVEKYIEKCLRSVMNQTYKNLEIIVVNDGSTDETLKIIRELANEDNRIIFINQDNKGVSASRNVALRKASGDFIMFVDSDDWVDEEICELLLIDAMKESAEVVICGYVREYENMPLPKACFDADRIIFEGQEVKDKLHRRIFGPIGNELSTPEKLNAITPIWGKLYKASVLEGLEFIPLDEVGVCEDGYFNIGVLKNVKKVVFVKKYFYHYRKIVSSGSLTQKKNYDFFSKEVKFYNKLNEIIENEKLPQNYKMAIDNRMVLGLIGDGIAIVNSNCNVYKKINNILKSDEYVNSCKNFSLRFLPLHWKVFFFFAKIKFTPGVYILANVIVKLMNKR